MGFSVCVRRTSQCLYLKVVQGDQSRGGWRPTEWQNRSDEIAFCLRSIQKQICFAKRKKKEKLQNFHQEDRSLLGFGVELGEEVEVDKGDTVEEEK